MQKSTLKEVLAKPFDAAVLYGGGDGQQPTLVLTETGAGERERPWTCTYNAADRGVIEGRLVDAGFAPVDHDEDDDSVTYARESRR